MYFRTSLIQTKWHKQVRLPHAQDFTCKQKNRRHQNFLFFIHLKKLNEDKCTLNSFLGNRVFFKYFKNEPKCYENISN